MPANTDRVKPGDVITIESFDLQNLGGKDKRIWSIYMGMDGLFDSPVFVYFCRTTTQIHDFKPGGKRENHKYRLLSKGQYGFEEDCLLDFSEKPYTGITKEKFNSYTVDIKDRLPDQIIKEIFEKCIKRYLNQFQQTSIRDSLAKVGINIK